MTPSQTHQGRSWILFVLLATSCRHLDLDLTSKPPTPPASESSSVDEKTMQTADRPSIDASRKSSEATSKRSADGLISSRPDGKPATVSTARSSPAAAYEPPAPPPALKNATGAGASPLSLATSVHASPKKPRKAEADDSTDEMERRLARIGAKLLSVNPSASVSFHFETLRNPRPRVNHTPDGHIYVTDGMLKEVSDDGELAGILALEMAELIHEIRRESPAYRKQAAVPEAPLSAADVDALAKQLLDHAGFPPSNLTALRERVRQLELARKTKENYRPLGPAMAN